MGYARQLMCKVAIGHMSNRPNIANLVYICTIKVHGREKRYDCYRNTKIVGKMNQKRRKVQTSGRVHTERTR